MSPIPTINAQERSRAVVLLHSLPTTSQDKSKGGVGSPSGFARGAGPRRAASRTVGLGSRFEKVMSWPSPSWKVAPRAEQHSADSESNPSVRLNK